MNATASVPGVNTSWTMGDSGSPSELFALTDEQILDIDPDSQIDLALAVIPSEARTGSSPREFRAENLSSLSTSKSAQQSKRDSSSPAASRNDDFFASDPESSPVAQPLLAVRGVGTTDTKTAQTASSASPEPPPWLARMMNDPWTGDEARELWTGVQQAQQEAAAYREIFAKPEEARATAAEARTLKELYPGGVEQARAAAERARTMEEIDAAFYGGAGKSPEQLSAGRAALAQRLLHEDPAAFREMVFAGLRALEGTGSAHSVASSAASSASPNVVPPLSVASFPAPPANPNVVPPFRAASVESPSASPEEGAGLKPGTTQATLAQPAAVHPQLAAYRTFEKSANDELERSVGGAINRAIEQALPVAQTILFTPQGPVRGDARDSIRPQGTDKSTQPGVATLQERLGAAIRQDVESALKGDHQLGEQIAQVLSVRRFDDSTRAQVVRLINDRAQQLVPVAARRVIQDWTQTAFAAHRGKGSNAVATTSDHRDVSSIDHRYASVVGAGLAPPVRAGHRAAQGPPLQPDLSRGANPASAVSAKSAAADRAERDGGFTPRSTARPHGRAVNYARLSDEQILDL